MAIITIVKWLSNWYVDTIYVHNLEHVNSREEISGLTLCLRINLM